MMGECDQLSRLKFGEFNAAISRIATTILLRITPALVPPSKFACDRVPRTPSQGDLKASVWAIRHYREESAANDPTSPFSGKAGVKGNDDDAVGFVFWYNPDVSKVAQVRYLSGAKNADEIATSGWTYSSPGRKPKIKTAVTGVVEITLELSKDNEGMFVLALLLQLGHGILL